MEECKLMCVSGSFRGRQRSGGGALLKGGRFDKRKEGCREQEHSGANAYCISLLLPRNKEEGNPRLPRTKLTGESQEADAINSLRPYI